VIGQQKHSSVNIETLLEVLGQVANSIIRPSIMVRRGRADKLIGCEARVEDISFRIREG